MGEEEKQPGLCVLAIVGFKSHVLENQVWPSTQVYKSLLHMKSFWELVAVLKYLGEDMILFLL